MSNIKRRRNWASSIVRYLLLVIFIPTLLFNFANAQKLATGSSSFAIDAKGNLYGWGDNYYGQLGIDNPSNQPNPVKVPFPTGVTGWSYVAEGAFHTLAIGNDNNLYVWGVNSAGQLGINLGIGFEYNKPSKVPLPKNVTGWKSIAGGMAHSLAISSDGSLYVCGDNSMGELGIAGVIEELSFTKVPFPSGVTSWVDIATGEAHSLALSSDSSLYAWGDNTYGQIGTGGTISDIQPPPQPYGVTPPVMVPFPSGVTSWTDIAAGNGHSLAIGSDGNLYSWGHNNYGQLGIGNTTDQYTPVKVPFPDGVTSWETVVADGNHSLAIGSDGFLYSWGRNNHGQLGIGNTTDQYIPVKVPFPDGVTSWKVVEAGFWYSLAVGNDDNLYACGNNSSKELGIGNTISQENSFVPVLALDGSGKLLTPIETDPGATPEKFLLYQNYPNPFNPTTRITYHLKNSTEVQLTVYDITGRQVIMLVNQKQSAGEHTAMFNGNHLSSGVYFYRLKAGNSVSTKKMLLLK